MDLFDSATKARLNLVYPDLATRVIRVINDVYNLHGLNMRVSEGIRTFEYQAKLYAQGRTAPGPIVTHSQPGDSIHHYGAATDLCFTGADPYLDHHPKRDFLWSEYGRLAEAHGLVWGGHFTHLCDRPHIQITYGLSLAQIKELYKNNKNAAVWSRFDQVRGVAIASEWDKLAMQGRLLDPKVPVDNNNDGLETRLKLVELTL